MIRRYISAVECRLHFSKGINFSLYQSRYVEILFMKQNTIQPINPKIGDEMRGRFHFDFDLTILKLMD